MTRPLFNEPFLFAVTDGNLDHRLDTGNNNMGDAVLSAGNDFIHGLIEDAREHGSTNAVYLCIPVALIATHGDNVVTERLETQLEVMAAAAIAVGDFVKAS